MGSAAHVTPSTGRATQCAALCDFPGFDIIEMLREQPEDLDDMAQISGVGARKLERYGAAFLKVLNQTEPATSAPATPEQPDLRHELVTLARSGMTPSKFPSSSNAA